MVSIYVEAARHLFIVRIVAFAWLATQQNPHILFRFLLSPDK